MNLTYAQLRDICVDNKIPRPTSAYWSALNFGKKVVKTPLPDPENNYSIELPDVKDFCNKNNDDKNTVAPNKTTKEHTVEPVLLRLNSIPVNEEEVEKFKKIERRKSITAIKRGAIILKLKESPTEWDRKINVAVTAYPIPTILHPHKLLILSTLEYYREMSKPWSQRNKSVYYVENKNHLSITASEEKLRHALAIYDSLIDIFNALGLKLIIEKNRTLVGNYSAKGQAWQIRTHHQMSARMASRGD